MAEEFYVPPALPKESKQAINDFVNLSKRTPEDYHNINMKGVGETRGFLSNDNSFEKNLGNYDPGLSKSIQDSANQKYFDNFRKLELESKHQAKDQYFRRLEHASDLVNQEFKYNEEIRIMKYKNKMAKKQARAGVISSVLGIGGAAVGAMVGGPAGAMAGYAVGSGVGGMAAY